MSRWVSAPYRFSRWVQGTIAGTNGVDAQVATVYLAYLSVAWNRLHELYRAPSDWYKSLYAERVDAIMDGSHEPDVPIDDSRECRGQLAARGSRVELVDVGNPNRLYNDSAIH